MAQPDHRRTGTGAFGKQAFGSELQEVFGGGFRIFLVVVNLTGLHPLSAVHLWIVEHVKSRGLRGG